MSSRINWAVFTLHINICCLRLDSERVVRLGDSGRNKPVPQDELLPKLVIKPYSVLRAKGYCVVLRPKSLVILAYWGM